ncbi:lysophospholipid acyltransferase family protein [Mucilaginibacter arboris]|uniref:1-acyl-sn-glycerol-3-phosphate acyltransferase n=1 Tax=Mucilaginibacter arboris TaxID=2682090 RepID=A0A7K1SS39_9SPHI|nr:lysophospholipid acyltransferase family protein [Mucilaginibacter arboris]MVN20037.1 1-acyl-sn-glycerol-3-phosphate acyltransferase [Mucilaginibacter arboris]
MKKLLSYLLTPLHYIAFTFFLLIFHPLQWIAFRFLGYKAHKSVVDLLNFCLVSTYYLLGNTVSFTNYAHLPLSRPIIFIANHQSLYDIPPLIWFLRKYHAKFISKIELTKGIPSISFNLKYGGGANIDRKDSRQAIPEMLKLGLRMKENNWSAVIFPEGTRSKNGVVKDFQIGGIATLLKKCPDALLVPVAICNSWKMVRFGTFPLGTFLKLEFEVLEPIEPEKQPAEILVKRAERLIKEALGQVSLSTSFDN